MTFSTLAMKPEARTRTPGPVEETLRLGMWNVFLAWRRTMSKVLLGLLLGAYALLVLSLLLLYALAVANSDEVTGVRAILTFPTSLALPGALVRYLAPIFAAILAGALVGGEYAFGTYRLSLARGNSRAQVLGGQILAMAFIALIVSALMLALGLLVGVTLGPLLGSDLVIPYPDGWVQILWYWLALSLNIWGYMLVALFFATWGRSAAAGIGGALGVFIVETRANAAGLPAGHGDSGRAPSDPRRGHLRAGAQLPLRPRARRGRHILTAAPDSTGLRRAHRAVRRRAARRPGLLRRPDRGQLRHLQAARHRGVRHVLAVSLSAISSPNCSRMTCYACSASSWSSVASRSCRPQGLAPDSRRRQARAYRLAP